MSYIENGEKMQTRMLIITVTIVFSFLLHVSRASGEVSPTNAVILEKDWSITVGAFTVTAPTYPGSKDRTTLPLPYWEIDYRHQFYSSGLDVLGYHIFTNDNWDTGAALQYDITERLEKSDDRLQGLGDVHSTIRARAFAGYSVSLLTVSGAVSKDIANNSQGTLLTLDITGNIPFVELWFFSAGPGVTWGDNEYIKTFFGVTPQQSSHSAFPIFKTNTGLVDAHINFLASYSISDHWKLTGVWYMARLLDNVAASPITETRNQLTGLVSLGYKF
jgi:MipA family protein